MIKKVKNWLDKPYYFNPSIKYKCKLSLVLGFFLFVFLYVFEPFTLSTFGEYLFSYTLGIGIVSVISGLFLLILLPLLFPFYFDEDKWTLGKNLFFIIICLYIIGSLLWIHGYYFKLNTGIEHLSYFRFLYYTLLVGLFPIFGFTYVNQINLKKKIENRATEINTIKKEVFKSISPSQTIVFKSENDKESLIILLKNLVYITSEGNYASFFILENSILKEKILRVTLSKIEELLSLNDQIIRCHKSYIINTKYVKGVKGNARGYLLQIDKLDFDIPVSRKFSKASLLSILKHPSYLSQEN